MRYPGTLYSLLLAIWMTGTTASGQIATVVKSTEDNAVQSASTTVQSFTAVDGPDLMSRLDAASRLGRAGAKPYWSAYAFDVRSNVAVDPALREFHGSMNTSGDTSVFVGTTANGMPVETRNLAVFLLREPGGNQITRMEVFNLERKREYSGYPVYWMARANNEESLNYLRAIADSAPLTMLGDRAVLSISLHDDVRVAQMLKNFSRNSPNQRIRSSSIYWLGQIGGEQAFLADIVRNENEDKRLRRTAAYAIGESRDQDALTTLQNLYDTVKDADVHRGIIQGIGNNQNQDAAIAFLLRVAKSDPERDARRTATRRLGEFDRDTADELMKIYSSDPDPDVRRSALQSLGQSKNAKAFARLLEVARSDAPNEMRRQAIRSLTQRGEAAAEDLIKLFDSESQLDVRRAILQSLSEIKGSRAEDKLFQVAREEENPTLRSQAIRMLGERAGKRSLDFLTATIENVDANTEVQLQAVRSLAQRPADEAVPLLIKLAKTHPNQSIRKQAIRSLAQSGDPRAVELFRELLSR